MKRTQNRSQLRIAIVGGGFTGLSAAYRLTQKGHKVTVFEQGTIPGGLALGFKEKGWDWTLEAFYHHWFLSDNSILELARELNYPVLIKRPKTAHLIEGKIYQLDSPATLLTFSKLSPFERAQMGIVLAALRFNPFWKNLEGISAVDFLSKTIGEKAYRLFWEPLLVGKFGPYTKDISLAWFWARIAKRTTKLAYPEGGFLQFAYALEKAIRANGGGIRYQASISQIVPRNNRVDLGQYGSFDKVLVTLPSAVFVKLAPELPETYREKLMQLKGLGAVCLILRLKKQFFNDNTYWLSICDTSAPVLAVVEHTNFMDSKHYHNEHLVYLGHYLPPGHPYFSLSEDALLAKMDTFLEKLSPGYKKQLIGMKKFSVPFAQPIIPTHYSQMIPPFETPLPNVYLANMQQVYPWDRGTNYAVALGDSAAKRMVDVK